MIPVVGEAMRRAAAYLAMLDRAVSSNSACDCRSRLMSNDVPMEIKKRERERDVRQ